MIEVEIKARVSDLASLKQTLDNLGAKMETTKKLVDKIYGKPEHLDSNGKYLEGELCPRIRDNNGSVRVEFKEIHRQGGGMEIETPVANIEFGMRFLEKLGYREAFTISKVRDCYKYNDFEIDIDQVELLGNFVEIEKMVASQDLIEPARQECLELLEKLIPGAEPANVKYGDLMQDWIDENKK